MRLCFGVTRVALAQGVARRRQLGLQRRVQRVRLGEGRVAFAERGAGRARVSDGAFSARALLGQRVLHALQAFGAFGVLRLRRRQRSRQPCDLRGARL